MVTVLPPTLYMPPPGQGNLTTMSSPELVPWTEEDPEFISLLGQRLRAKRPVYNFVEQRGCQLLPYHMPAHSVGQLYALVTPAWRDAAGYRTYQTYNNLEDEVQRRLDDE